MAYLGNSFNQQSFTPATDFFSGNGVTTTFTLTRPVQSVYGLEVVVNNVQQNPSSTYSVNASNQLVFVTAPSAGTNNIYVVYNSPLSQQNGVGQGTVGTQQLGSVSNINSVASNMTLQTNGVSAVTIDQNQNVAVANGNFSVGTGAPGLYSKATVYYSGLYETTTRRYLDISGDFAGTNAAAATNAGAVTGIRMGYPALPGKSAIVGAVSEDVLGYARKTGLTFQTSAYDTAPVERMRITGEGYPLTPFRPGFFAYGNGASTAYGAAAEFICNLTQYNQSNSYSTSTGRFTAPIAGFYHFSYGAYIYSAVQLAFKRNGSDYAPSDAIGLNSVPANSISGTSIQIYLNVGDTTSFGFRSGYSGNVYMSHTWFSGFLIS